MVKIQAHDASFQTLTNSNPEIKQKNQSKAVDDEAKFGNKKKDFLVRFADHFVFFLKITLSIPFYL